MRPLTDYILSVKTGPNDTSLQPLPVNHEDAPVYVKSDLFQGYIMMRMKDYPGICSKGPPLLNPSSNYFDTKQRLYSISIQGVFSEDVGGNDLNFGIDMNGPIKTPPGTSIALRIAKWLEPSLQYDLNSDFPHMDAPMISTMSSLGIYSVADFKKEFQVEVIVFFLV